MLEIETIAFEKYLGRPLAAVMRFAANARGEIEHYIDGELRATIPPEGWDQLCLDWPYAQQLVGQMIKPTLKAAGEGLVDQVIAKFKGAAPL